MAKTIALAALIFVTAQASAFATAQHLKIIGEQCAAQLKLTAAACVEAEPRLVGVLTESEIATLGEHVANFDCLEKIAGQLNSHPKSQ